VVPAGLAVIAALALPLLMGSRALLRAQIAGTEDARFCILPGTLAAIRDNGVLGSGLASFGAIFPPYRDPGCGLGTLWDRAHDFFLEGALSLGLMFPLVCAVSLACLLYVWGRGIRTGGQARQATSAGLAITCLVSAHSMVDFSLQVHGIAVFVAAALAGCAARALEPGRGSNSLEPD
jgi:hypothetical protein